MLYDNIFISIPSFKVRLAQRIPMHTRRNKTNPPKGRNAEMFKNKSNKNNKRLKQSTRMRKIFVFDSQGIFANDFVS